MPEEVGGRKRNRGNRVSRKVAGGEVGEEAGEWYQYLCGRIIKENKKEAREQGQ